jgi:polysaccharide export outer membrane protein
MFVRGPKAIVIAVLASAGCCIAQTKTNQMGSSAEVRPESFKPAAAVSAPDAAAASFRTTAPMPLVTPALAKDYRLSANDLFDVEVFEMDNLKRTVRINAAGMVSLPLIGAVAVGGLSVPEAEERIAKRYSEKYLQDPQVSIFIKEFTTERITVEGAIGRPGIFPLTGQMTLLRVIALAGGFGSIANTSEVMIFRVNENNVRQVATFDVEQIRAGKAEDPLIKGDDLIVVQRDKVRAMLKDSLFRDVIDSVNPFSILIPK